MDGLIIVLAIIGIIIKASNKNKKKAQKGGAASPAPARKIKPQLEKWLDEIENDPDLEDLNKEVSSIQEALQRAAKVKAAPVKPQPAHPKVAPAQPQVAPQPKQITLEQLAEEAALRAHAEERIPCHDHEGLHSTQGESAAEHAEHFQKIRETEEVQRAQQQALQNLRSVNLQKLRTAVVMSEVLGKPVALRRGRR